MRTVLAASCLALALTAPSLPARQSAQGASGLVQLGSIETCQPAQGPSELPPGFTDEELEADWIYAAGLVYDPFGRLIVWEKRGVVWIVEDGEKLPTPLLDISQEVANWGDTGLLGLALDPDFASNGLLYLLYNVDRHHLLYFGTPAYDPAADEPQGNTIGRVTRFTAKISDGFHTVDPASRLVLLGRKISDGAPYCGTHAIGGLAFFEDGTLAASFGDGSGAGESTCAEDGILPPEHEIGGLRSQVVDTLSGKVVRLNPATGAGVPSNPYFDPAQPRSARSRVWSLGLRNPFRLAVRPGSGDPDRADEPGVLFIGDVGGGLWEELDVARGGDNFGWPLYEGNQALGVDTSAPNPSAPNPLFGVGGCTQEFFSFGDLLLQDSLAPPQWKNPCAPGMDIPHSIPVFVHRRPELAWGHIFGPAVLPTYDALGAAAAVELGTPGAPAIGESFAGQCAVGGAWYTGSSFPPEYQGTYFVADFGARWIRNLVFDSANRLVEIRPFAKSAGAVVSMSVDPLTGDLAYIDFDDQGLSVVRRIVYHPGDVAPEALAATTPAWGKAPLLAIFSSQASKDPEGGALRYLWEFSDGTPVSTLAKPVRFAPAVDITHRGTFHTKVQTLDPPLPMGFGSQDPEVLRDGVWPTEGIAAPELQYDTWHWVPTTFQPDKGGDDWIGWTFEGEHMFVGLVYQEGVRWPNLLGGWFEQLNVQVRETETGEWRPVAGLVVAEPYPSIGAPNGLTSYQRYELRFSPMTGTGIRLYGQAGGSLDFVSAAELRALARQKHTQETPFHHTARLTVTDEVGNQDCTAISIAMNDAPPTAVIAEPVDGDGVPAAGATVALIGLVSDPVYAPTQLSSEWRVTLHHGAHEHPQSTTYGTESEVQLPPLDLEPGTAQYWQVLLTVTDPLGLTAQRSAFLYSEQDCNLNGLRDSLEIAVGLVADADGNGVPDACQRDCDGNGIHDPFDLVLGNSVDANGDGVPDECQGLFQFHR